MLSGAVFESGRLRQGAGAHRGGNSSSIAAVASGTMSKIVRATHASTAAPRVTNEANHETHRLQGIDVRLLRYTDRLGNRHSRCIRAAGRTLEVEAISRTDSQCICRARARAGRADAAPEVLVVARHHIQAHRRELVDARTVGRVRGVWSVIAEVARVSGYGGRAEISETALPALRALERRQRKLLVHEPYARSAVRRPHDGRRYRLVQAERVWMLIRRRIPSTTRRIRSPLCAAMSEASRMSCRSWQPQKPNMSRTSPT